MLHPGGRTPGVVLSHSRLSAKHKDEYFGTISGLPAAITGKRYYEVTIKVNRGGIIAGWTSNNSDVRTEIGANDFSWGVSSFAGNKGHNNKWTAYLQKMKPEDCIGCIVDTNNGEISFTLNGLGNGIAFKGPVGGRYYPAISLKHKKTSVTVNFGSDPLKFMPDDCLPLNHMPEVIAQEEEHANATEQENYTEQNKTQHNILIPEILAIVMGYLDARSLARCALANRFWAKLVNEPSVWQKVYEGMVQMKLSSPIALSDYRTRCAHRFTLENSLPSLSSVFPCKYVPSCLQFDNDKLICGGFNNLVVFEDCFNDEYGLSRRLISGHTGIINDLQYDDSLIVTTAADHSIKLWDVDDFSCIGTIHFTNMAGGNCVRFNKQQNTIYSFSGCEYLEFHDLNTLTCTMSKHFSPSHSSTQQMSVSEDGRTVVVASSEIFVIDMRSHQVVNSFYDNPDLVTFCNGLADQRNICIYTNEEYALYDVFTGQSILEFEGGSYERMTCIYSDLGYVAAGFEDCDVRMWNVATEIPQACILEPTCIRFDEGKLICGSEQTKCNMYTFGPSFEDEYGMIYESDKAAIRKWTKRMQFYDKT